MRHFMPHFTSKTSTPRPLEGRGKEVIMRCFCTKRAKTPHNFIQLWESFGAVRQNSPNKNPPLSGGG